MNEIMTFKKQYKKGIEIEKRYELLKKLYQEIVQNENNITKALFADLHKSKEESYMTEIGQVLQEITYLLKNLRKLTKKRRVKGTMANFLSRNYELPSPQGVVLIMGTWNYPFSLSLTPLISAIAAGNYVVVKLSELSVNTNNVIYDILNKAPFTEFIKVVLGSHEASNKLLEIDFDHVFYTGGENFGKVVYEKQARFLTKVTLELGGKSPCIIDETANLDLAARRIIFGKLLNAGQTCIAPDYIYCHHLIKDKLIKKLQLELEKQFKKESFPHIISERHFKRIIGLIDDSEVINDYEIEANKRYLSLVLLNSSFNSKVMQEEIFGPLLPIISYKNNAEIIENLKNKTPLALYLFSKDKNFIKDMTQNISFGGGCINDTIMHFTNNNLAFGGIKHSGIGKYHGKHGFDTFTHYKSITKTPTWLDIPLRYHPEKKLYDKIIRFFLK